MYDVVVCGSAVIDVFVKTHCDTISINDKKEIAYPLGSKIIINEKRTMIGGGGTNTATAFSRLNLNTAYLGCLGDDVEGKEIIDFLENEKVEFIGYQTKDFQTGYSVILDSQNDDRTLLTFKGANNELDYKKINIPETKWIYSSSLIENSYNTLKEIAKNKKAKLAFNPSSYQAKQGLAKLKPVLQNTDLLILNLEEAQELTKSEANINEQIKLIYPKLNNDATIIITDGKNGALLHNNKHTLNMTPTKVNVLETTGAGDCFAATYLGYKLHGLSDQMSLVAAMENVKSVITNYGAKNILLTESKLNSIMKNSKVKVETVNL